MRAMIGKWTRSFRILYVHCFCNISSVSDNLYCVAASYIQRHEIINSVPIPTTQETKLAAKQGRPLDLARADPSFPRHTPRLGTHLLCLHERPRVRSHADTIVDGRVRGLIHQRGAQRRHRVHAESGLDAAVHAGEGVDEGLERPLPGEREQREDQVDDLEGWEGFDGWVEHFG